MYQFVTGPLAWISFAVFFVGVIVRAVMYFRGLDWQMDRVAYRVQMRDGIRGAARSIFRWLLPYGTHSWRFYPVFTFFVFLFHVGLLGVALFYEGHNILMLERLGFRLPSLPAFLGDALTIGVMVAAVFIVLRRIALPEVRILTTAYDLLLLAIAVAPFLTGFIAAHHIGGWRSAPTAACAPTAVFSIWPTTKTPNRCPPTRSSPPWARSSRARGKVDNAFMQMVMDTAWSKCTCCNRCGTYCPFGIDMGVMFSYLRGLLLLPGVRALGDEDRFGHAPGLPRPDGCDHRGLGGDLRVDGRGNRRRMAGTDHSRSTRMGADIMYTVNAREPKHYPEDLAEAAILFHSPAKTGPCPARAGRRPAWPCSPATGKPARCRSSRVYEAMERLKPKRMVVTECGHAYRATVIEGPYWAGLPTARRRWKASITWNGWPRPCAPASSRSIRPRRSRSR
jgi:nitrate reductase gamma subunit/ferredoxin